MNRKENTFVRARKSELEKELKRVESWKLFFRVMKSTIGTLLVVAAISVLVATLWMPVLRIYGNSMTPTLDEGNIVISVKGMTFETGDLISFYYGNRLLVKRVVAGPGDWVNMDQDGNVFINGELINEPYLTEKAYGEVTIEFPYQVPDSRYFVLGDHRATSADSRSQIIGCVAEEQIVGKIVFRLWPFAAFGRL